jgi:predicted anti-sigma-YlaC factor YlaD
MITGHLQDRTFASWANDPTDAVATAHLNECEACRKEAVDFRGKLSAFREAILEAGEARRLDWTIPAEAETRPSPLRLAILTWAPRLVLTTMLVLFAFLSFRPKPVAPPSPAQSDDQALLLSVDESLSRSVPKALAPVEYMVSEANQSSDTDQNVAQ